MGKKIGLAVLTIFALIGVIAVIGGLGMLLMHGSMMGSMTC